MASSERPVDVAAQVAPGALFTCESLPGDYGDSWRDDAGVHIRLSRPMCGALSNLANHRIRSWQASANALETVLHERDHWPADRPDGVSNESVVDCEALHSLPFWLRRLGYTGRSEVRLLKGAWAIHYGLPSNYLTTSCRSPFGEPKPVFYTIGPKAKPTTKRPTKAGVYSVA